MRRPPIYQPGTIVQASDREYFVDAHGSLRVHEYVAGDVRDSELYTPVPVMSPEIRAYLKLAIPNAVLPVDPEMPVVQAIEEDEEVRDARLGHPQGDANVVEDIQQPEPANLAE